MPVDPVWSVDLPATPRLHLPVPNGKPWTTVYGYGSMLQVSPTQVAILVNRRVTGHAVVDFEDGTDALVTDSLDRLDPAAAVPVSRSQELAHPKTGKRLVTRCIMLTGGFVPLGARLPDGKPHPHAGTGFVFGGHGACLAEPKPHRAEGADGYGFQELIQLRFDGKVLSVTRRDRIEKGDQLIRGFMRVSHGLSNALPDGADLIAGVYAGPVGPGAEPGSPAIPCKHPHADGALGRNVGSCFCRWRFGDKGWRPAEIVPVSGPDLAMEPTVVREADGSLLMAVRGKGLSEPPGSVTDGLENTYEHFRVYRSMDNGATWERVLHLPRRRNATPVVLNRSLGGRPFICANPYEDTRDSKGRLVPSHSRRNRLGLWPLTPDRAGVEQPLMVLEANQRFGPPREGVGEPLPTDNIWYLDHPVANVVRLGDGRWRCLLGFRVSEMAVNLGGAGASEKAGYWVGEVHAPGDDTPLPAWIFQ
jgi:hypothetical protein